MNNFKSLLQSTSDSYWLKRTHVQGLEIAIYSTIHKIRIMLAETPFLFLCGSQLVCSDQMIVNIHEGLALIYRLCPRDKDIFTDDCLHKS